MTATWPRNHWELAGKLARALPNRELAHKLDLVALGDLPPTGPLPSAWIREAASRLLAQKDILR